MKILYPQIHEFHWQTKIFDKNDDTPLSRYSYTVYFDNSLGEFLWGKKSGSGTPTSRGGNIFASYMDCAEDQDIMSIGLFNSFCDWANFYMMHDHRCFEGTADIDWVLFNERGMLLAERLKEELGDAADVFYLSAYGSPKELFPNFPVEVILS